MRALALILFFLVGCGEKIVSDLDQSKTNQILIALSKYGVAAKKVKEGGTWSVEVSKQDSAKALEILAVGRFLHAEDPQESSSSFVQSKSELQHTLERKLSRSLEETLERMPYVLEARVHVSSSEAPEFAKTSPEKTASVLVITEPGHEPNLEKIQKLISGASGLKPETVTVVSLAAQEPVKVISTQVNKVDKGFLALIPILFSSILLVRRFDSTSRKNKEVKKILKLENE